MIRFNWRRKSDQAPMAEVRVSWKLTVEDMAGALIAAVRPLYPAELTEMTRAEVETQIRDALYSGGSDKMSYWRDAYADDTDGDSDLTAEEAEEWATRQVRKLLPPNLR
jgi:hypothetical protein